MSSGGNDIRLNQNLLRMSLAALGVVLAAAAGVAFLILGPGPRARQGETTTIILSKGQGVGELSKTLSREGVIFSPELFRLAMKYAHADRTLKPGEYEVPSGESLMGLVSRLARGERVRHFITVAEGRTSAQVVRALKDEKLLTGELAQPQEGSILPETYEFTRGESRLKVLERMQEAQKAELNKLWAQRAADTVVKTPQEAVILASVVEKETGKANERPLVAAAFSNRLKTGMRLESDPTVIYGVSKGEPLGRGILASELRAITPWNTYRINGLPKTAIANPGREAIRAVLNPAKSRAVYFVADGTGGHVFAETYPEHLANVAKWRQIEKKAAASAKP